MEEKTLTNQKFTMKNSQRQVVNIWLCLMTFFVFCIFLPTLIGLDGFDGGFAISFVSGFMAIISLIVILVYHSRANQLNLILSGEGRIAVWNYSPQEWTRFVEKDFEEDKKLKRMLFFLIAGISVVIGIILGLAHRDFIFIPIVMGIIALVAVPAILAPRYRHKKLQHSQMQVLIAEKGVIVGNMFHLWVKLGASLDEVTMEYGGETNLIDFKYSMPTRNGRQEEVARVPVPYGKAEEAERIVTYFQGKL
jgi:hypothetical protein